MNSQNLSDSLMASSADLVAGLLEGESASDFFSRKGKAVIAPWTKQWTLDDYNEAAFQGWRMSFDHDTPDRIERVDRSDGPRQFSDDREAWKFVTSQARAGSVLARKALSKIGQVERNLIRKYTPPEDWDWLLPDETRPAEP